MKEKKVASKNRYYPKDAWKLPDRKSTLNSSHDRQSRMPASA